VNSAFLVAVVLASLGCGPLPTKTPAPLPQRVAPRPRTLDTAKLLAQLREPEACLRAVGETGQVTECSARSVGNGQGVLVTVVGECGSDSCAVSAWLLRDSGSPLRLSGYSGGTLAFSPSLRYFVTDAREFRDQEELSESFYHKPPQLFLVELETGKQEFFADCMSPELSPEGAEFLCRNRYGDVLATPTTEGRLRLVWSNSDQQVVPFSPYAFIYPEPVEFLSPGAFSVPDAAGERVLSWPQSEIPVTMNELVLGASPARVATSEDGTRIFVMDGAETAGSPSLEAAMPAPGGHAKLQRSQPGEGVAPRAATPFFEPPLSPLRLSDSELLLPRGPALRLLRAGRLAFAFDHPLLESPGQASTEPERHRTVKAMALNPEERWVVLEYQGEPEVERWVVVRLPRFQPEPCLLGRIPAGP